MLKRIIMSCKVSQQKKKTSNQQQKKTQKPSNDKLNMVQQHSFGTLVNQANKQTTVEK